MAPSTGSRIQKVDLQFKPIIVQLPMCSCATVGTCMGYVKEMCRWWQGRGGKGGVSKGGGDLDGGRVVSRSQTPTHAQGGESGQLLYDLI